MLFRSRATMTQADCGEGGFDRVGCSQVRPVLGREVVERQQHITVFRQALTRRWIFRFVFFQEVVEGRACDRPCFRVPDFVQVGFGFELNALRKLIQDVRCFVNRAALFSGFGKQLAGCGPESQGSELLSNLVFRGRNQAAFSCMIPSVNV